MLDRVGVLRPHAAVAPKATAISRNDLLVIPGICSLTETSAASQTITLSPRDNLNAGTL